MMKIRFQFLSGVIVLASCTGAFAATTGSGSPPPGPVTPAPLTNAPPATPAPLQPNAKSAPGAAVPSGANGTDQYGNPITKAPNTPTKSSKVEASAPAPAPQAGRASSPLLDAYIQELNEALKLTPEEQTDIETYYRADGAQTKSILDNSADSPIQQAEEVSDLRDARDTKIEALLQQPDRQHEFFAIEKRYRVALTELAADGGLAPKQGAPSAPSPTTTAPGQAEPTPTTNKGNAQ